MPKKTHLVAPNLATKKAQFLEEYRKCGTKYFAAKRIGVSRETARMWENADPEFAAAVLHAFDDNTQILRQTAYNRALAGISKGADSLLMFLLKQRDPSFRERVDMTHMGPDGKPLDVAVDVKIKLDLAAIPSAILQQALERLVDEPLKLPGAPAPQAAPIPGGNGNG